jgi:hypothetical protein
MYGIVGMQSSYIIYLYCISKCFFHSFEIYVRVIFSAELDESEGASVSLDKVLNCATSCISVAFPQDIINQKKNVVELILNSLLPEESWQGIWDP